MANISTEDYIKAVYKLERASQKVTTSALAAELGLADASITDMVKKLSDRGLLNYTPYQGVGLTAKGRRMALQIIRRHRLWEMFLVKFLGFSWDQVHDEAERLEHVTSDELEQRLDKALGFPNADPHGDPIPGADGRFEQTDYRALTEYDIGDVVRVLRVSDKDSEILQHASKLGLHLNKKLTVRNKMNFDGSIVVRLGSKEHFLSKEVASSIFVEPA
jgi:DtxR family Mn-dependent transcriptional regulator